MVTLFAKKCHHIMKILKIPLKSTHTEDIKRFLYVYFIYKRKHRLKKIRLAYLLLNKLKVVEKNIIYSFTPERLIKELFFYINNVGYNSGFNFIVSEKQKWSTKNKKCYSSPIYLVLEFYDDIKYVKYVYNDNLYNRLYVKESEHSKLTLIELMKNIVTYSYILKYRRRFPKKKSSILFWKREEETLEEKMKNFKL